MYEHAIPTPFLKKILLDQFRTALNEQKFATLNSFLPFPSVAWIMFEAIAIEYLTMAGNPPLEVNFADATSKLLNAGLTKSAIPFDHVYSDRFFPRTLYVPSISFPSIDAVFYRQVSGLDEVFLLQATIAQKHSVNLAGIRKVLNQLGPNRIYYYLWLVPSEDLGRKLTRASGVLKLREYGVEISVGWAVIKDKSSSSAIIVSSSMAFDPMTWVILASGRLI